MSRHATLEFLANRPLDDTARFNSEIVERLDRSFTVHRLSLLRAGRAGSEGRRHLPSQIERDFPNRLTLNPAGPAARTK